MKDGAAAVDLIGFAAAFKIEFEEAPFENHLARQESLGGMSQNELFARVHFLRFKGRSKDLADFIETNWERLVEIEDIRALGGLLIESLSLSGQCGRAAEVLETVMVVAETEL